METKNISETETRQIHLKVMTPVCVVFDKHVDFVIMRSKEGDMGILYGHEPYSALLDYGTLRIIPNNKNKEEELLMVLGGIVIIQDNEVVVLSEMAEHPDKMQEAINKLKEERAANKLKEEAADLDMHRAEMAIRRALVHMDVSAYSIIKDHGEQT